MEGNNVFKSEPRSCGKIGCDYDRFWRGESVLVGKIYADNQDEPRRGKRVLVMSCGDCQDLAREFHCVIEEQLMMGEEFTLGYGMIGDWVT